MAKKQVNMDETLNNSTSSLTVGGLCHIMETGSRCGILRIELADTTILFTKKDRQITSERQSAKIKAAIDREASDQLAKDELRAKEDRLEQMIIEDPAEAESLILEGDLEDDADESDIESGVDES